MRSHIYEASWRDLGRLILPSVGVFSFCAACLHGAAGLGWLPERPATLYADETVLRHQAAARKRPHPARIVLVGDSTCHAAVDAAALSQQLPAGTPVLNLGLILGIDFAVYGQIASEFAASNPNQVRWVVLLITPTRLATRGDRSLWDLICRGAETDGEQNHAFAVGKISGGRLIRERLASRLLPAPLRGRGAQQFGFTTGLDAYMTAHDGSVVDFGELQLPPNQPLPEFPVSDEFATACRDFRTFLPANVKLAVGLTPSAPVAAPALIRPRYFEVLQQLDRLLEPNALLTNLPVSLPVPAFSSSAHLNATGQAMFTAALARELARLP